MQYIFGRGFFVASLSVFSTWWISNNSPQQSVTLCRDRDTTDRTLALRSESGPPFLIQVNFDDSAGTVSSQRGFSLEYLQIPCWVVYIISWEGPFIRKNLNNLETIRTLFKTSCLKPAQSALVAPQRLIVHSLSSLWYVTTWLFSFLHKRTNFVTFSFWLYFVITIYEYANMSAKPVSAQSGRTRIRTSQCYCYRIIMDRGLNATFILCSQNLCFKTLT